MVRWELYVNFFYSWIIFSLRCHQVEFSVLHWNEYSSQSYSFWKTCREKDKKPWTPFLPPLHAALKHAQLPWVTKAPHSIHVLLGMGLELARCPLMWDWGVTTKFKSFGSWGLQEQWEQWGAALVLPSRRWRYLSSWWSVQTAFGRLNSYKAALDCCDQDCCEQSSSTEKTYRFPGKWTKWH